MNHQKLKCCHTLKWIAEKCRMTKNKKIMICLKRVTRKLNKYIENKDKNERKYKKLEIRS